MNRSPLRTLLAACIATCMTTACAQSRPDARPLPGPAARMAVANEAIAPLRDRQRARIGQALADAERGRFDAATYADLTNHPLYGWVEYANARRNIDGMDATRMRSLLARYEGQASGDALREVWLAALSRRQDWAGFEADWRAGIDDLTLRCAHLQAQQALGRTDHAWTGDAQALWVKADVALPAICDGPMQALAAQGGLTDAMRWSRFDAALAEGRGGVMRAAAQGLPASEAALAQDYARYLDAPGAVPAAWPRTARSRRVASIALARAAKANPDAVEAQLPAVAQALGFTDADRGRVLYEIALWTVASYGPRSAERLNAVPAVSYDARLHEWRAREAMARSDWPAALRAIRAMGAEQRAESRWTYFEARLAEQAGERAAAQSLYRRAATKPEFHGFLAADRIGADYPLCPLRPVDAPALRAQVAADPALVRAFGLYALQRGGWAEREWKDALSRFDDAQRRIAVEAAQANGWWDRAVFALGKTPSGEPRPDELRLYHLRFPLHHDATIRRAASAHRIDPAWVAAEIRAESVFNPNARSPANAMGLMQLIPSTGMATARDLGLQWPGPDALYDPDFNITLGTAHLRELLNRYGGTPYEAMAGYNAGPAPLKRWQSQRPGMDADYWIETISYKETRDYVARVLAFSVLYDWRMDGSARRVSDRMVGRLDGMRVRFTCPAPSA